MKKLANHTTLKEWASAIDALGRGAQVILIRKGGIADPTFGVEAQRFYLYPTYFHQPDQPESGRAVTITHWCEIVRIWRVQELETLLRLAPLVVFSRDDLATRYRFRSDQAAHVLGIRTYRLASPTSIAPNADYDGCRSWISVDEEIDIEGSEPVLADEALQEALDRIQSLLPIEASPFD